GPRPGGPGGGKFAPRAAGSGGGKFGKPAGFGKSPGPHGPPKFARTGGGPKLGGGGASPAPRPMKEKRPAAAAAAPVAPPTHWSGVADWYDKLVGDEGSEYHRHVVLPGTVRLLAPQIGDTILDIACGQGVLCRLLAARGVIASGVDAAEELVKKAKRREREAAAAGLVTGTIEPDAADDAPDEAADDAADSSADEADPDGTTPAPGVARPPIRYHLGDARDLSFLPETEFTAAACVLAIQNIHPIGPVFRAVSRVLKPLGRFVVVMMHPCFRGPKETSWGWDAENGVQYRRVDRYLLPRKAPIVTHPGMSDQYTWSFHKPIGDYVKAARGAGLLVDAIEEWPSHKTSTGTGPRPAAENTARKEIPMFLALRCVKVGLGGDAARGGEDDAGPH
ncbi:MAG: class I SAM-dependent methyltransferase, partial [Phycisphaerae bacterium]